MTISSIVVQTKPENLETLVETLKESDLCEYHLHDEKGRIVITLEGENVGQEVEKLGKIQKIKGIISAEMVYSHSEDELEKLRDDIETAPTPEWLNSSDNDASKIKYNGDLRKKF